MGKTKDLANKIFNRKFWKFREEIEMEQIFPGKTCENLGITREVVPFFISYVNSQLSIVLLVAITVSWTSHAKLTDQDFGPGRMACGRPLNVSSLPSFACERT